MCYTHSFVADCYSQSYSKLESACQSGKTLIIFNPPPLVRYLCGNARIGISAQIATYQNIFNFLN